MEEKSMCTKRRYISAEGPASFRLLPVKPIIEVDASYLNPRKLTRQSELAAADEAIMLASGEVVRVVGRVVCECQLPRA